MKRISTIILVLALALILVPFAMAGGKQETAPAAGKAAEPAKTEPAKAAEPAKAEKIVIDAMAYGNNSNQEGLTWQRIVESFEKANPNITIKYELLYDPEYHSKVPARLAAGEIPDLAYFGPDARWGTPWKEAGQFWDHKPFLDANYYDFKMIPPHGPNGEIYEVPLQASNMCTILFMNKALVESLGFTTPKTYEDMVAMVPAATKAGIDVLTIDGADGWAWASCLMSAVIARVSGDGSFISKTVAGQKKFTDKEWVDSLGFITRMVKDGVLKSKYVTVDYGTNQSIFGNKQALFMVQGHWAAQNIDPAVRDTMMLLPWPKLPGEKANMAGSIAAAPSVGYGLTKKGASDPKIRDAALKFINYFYSVPESEQRLRDGAIIAPVLKNFKVPDDLEEYSKQKVVLAQNNVMTEVIDSFLSGAPNDALMAGMQRIAAGQATAAQVAAEVDGLMNK